MIDLHPSIDKIVFSTYEVPKSYDNIPQSYQMNWEDPTKFIPDRLLKYFNQKIYYNFLHRECFNSVVLPGNSLTEIENQQFANCQNKHRASLGIFQDIMIAKKKWQGFKHYINIKEYSRTPEEMTTSVPTDPLLRGAYLNYVEANKHNEVKRGFPELFGMHTPHKTDIIQAYLSGVYLNDTNIQKNKKEREDKYTEYKELSAKYDNQIKELLKKRVNTKNWKDILGENFDPLSDGEESETEPEVETSNSSNNENIDNNLEEKNNTNEDVSASDESE